MDVRINFEGVDCIVQGYYQPSERQTFDYPGCPESFDVEAVFVGGSMTDISSMIGQERCEDLIAPLCLEAIAEMRIAA